MRRSDVLRAGRSILSVLAVLLGSQNAVAGEQLLEGFRGGAGFAPMWGEATIERPTEGGFSQLQVTTRGAGEGVLLSNARAYRPALDLTSKFVKFLIKIDALQNLGCIEFRLSSDRFSSDFYAFEVPIYEDPEFNFLAGGTWIPLTFSFGQARVEGNPDRSAIDSVGVYLNDTGRAPLVFGWGAVLAVDEPDHGMVSITFDDGYDEHYEVAAKIMAEYGLRGTAYVIPRLIGRAGHMTMPQLVEMQNRWGWDIAAHHETPFTQFTPEELESVILGLREFLLVNGFGRGAAHLAYPLGKQSSPAVRSLVRKHFGTARIASFGPETVPPADRHLLRVYNVLRSTSPEEIDRAVRQAKQHKQWLILMFHHLVETPQTDIDYQISHFEKTMQLISKAKMVVVPVSEAWDAGRSAPSVPAASR